MQEPDYLQKIRSHSSYSLPLNRHYLFQSKKLINKNNSTHSFNSEIKHSYSVLKFQMEDNGKVTIQTNRRAIRTFSAAKAPEPLKPEFINSAQFFHYTPTKIPSPLHQITLKKQKKTVLVRMPEKKVLRKHNQTSDLIKQKIIAYQNKQNSTHQLKPSKMHLEPKVSYSKLFQQISENPMKYYAKSKEYGILFDDQFVKNLHQSNSVKATRLSIRESQARIE